MEEQSAGGCCVLNGPIGELQACLLEKVVAVAHAVFNYVREPLKLQLSAGFFAKWLLGRAKKLWIIRFLLLFFIFIFSKGILLCSDCHLTKFSLKVNKEVRLIGSCVGEHGLNEARKRTVPAWIDLEHAILDQVEVAYLHGLHSDMPYSPSTHMNSRSWDAKTMDVIHGLWWNCPDGRGLTADYSTDVA